ncbi:MAG TPA: hypothetical protein VGZ47_07490 [Gemmataceae bacterium]|jgi:hypothetical protein|nr:hypothetical protein [Gemmataceae bacterium]
MHRVALWLCLTFAVALAGWAAWSAFTCRHDGPVFALSEAERDCGELPVGPATMIIRATNQSREAARIVGFSPG